MKFLKYLALGLLLSCSPKAKITTTTKVSDTTIVTTMPVDTIVYIEAHKAEVDGVYVKVDSTGKANLPEITTKQDHITLKIRVKDNKITYTAETDHDSVPIRVYNTKVEHTKDTKKETVEVKVKKEIPKSVLILSTIGVMFILLIVILVVRFFTKRL